eukprot:1160320-Pelagomonas_calceolata.AAC.8
MAGVGSLGPSEATFANARTPERHASLALRAVISEPPAWTQQEWRHLNVRKERTSYVPVGMKKFKPPYTIPILTPLILKLRLLGSTD